MTEEKKDEEKKAEAGKVEEGKTYSAAEVEAMRANDKQAMERLHKKATKASDDLKSKLEAIEAKEKEAERAKMEESDRLKLEKEELQKELAERDKILQTKLIEFRIREVGMQAGVVDADDLVLLMRNRDGIEIGEDGKVSGVTKAIEAMKEAKPHMFGSGKRDGKPPDPSGAVRERGEQTVDEDAFRQEHMTKRNAIWG